MSLPVNPVKRFFYRGITSAASTLTSILLSVYQATLEIEITGEENLLTEDARENNYIIAVWHSFINAALFTFNSRRLLVFTDHPRLESYEKSPAHFFREIGIKTLRSLGYEVLDASLGKQSAGILNFVKKIRDGFPALIAPDGPDGPIYEAKPGTIYVASKANSVILPVGFGFSRKILGRNWDDFSLPLPFSKVTALIGKPISVPSKLNETTQKQYTEILEKELDDLSFRANEIALSGSGDNQGKHNERPEQN
ncbi:MAG: hypothetical protein OEZ34_07300 [Spirochaetia bacterium]|nr:hypothetical protein [Spirochaetia bacterium]